MDVLKYLICKLNAKEGEGGPSTQRPLPSVRFEAEDGKFRLSVWPSALGDFGMGCHGVQHGYTPAFLESRLGALSVSLCARLSLFLSPRPAHMGTHHTNTRSALVPTLLSWLLRIEHAFSTGTTTKVWPVGAELALPPQLASRALAVLIDTCPNCEKTVCKTRFCIFKSYTKHFHYQGGNIGPAWNDQVPQRFSILSSNVITCISSCVALGQ